MSLWAVIIDRWERTCSAAPSPTVALILSPRFWGPRGRAICVLPLSSPSPLCRGFLRMHQPFHAFSPSFSRVLFHVILPLAPSDVPHRPQPLSSGPSGKVSSRVRSYRCDGLSPSVPHASLLPLSSPPFPQQLHHLRPLAAVQPPSSSAPLPLEPWTRLFVPLTILLFCPLRAFTTLFCIQGGGEGGGEGGYEEGKFAKVRG